MAITIKNEEQIELMRRAGQMLARVHAELAKELKEGMTTKDVDTLVEEMILSFGGYPNFKNYNGFPAAACVSLNDEVVHGIPSDSRYLKNGDIVSIDTGVLYKGYHSDAARTHAIGEVSEEVRKLIRVTEESFFEGIKKARPGNHISDIGQAVQNIALRNGFSVVRDLTGHGIGTDLHEAPNVPNYKTFFKGPRLRKGMTLAVEPMINMGNYSVKRLEDNWTFATADGSLSAHYENTIAVTDGVCEILTMLPEEIELRLGTADKNKPKGDIVKAVKEIPEEFAAAKIKEKDSSETVPKERETIVIPVREDDNKKETSQQEVSAEKAADKAESAETAETEKVIDRLSEEAPAVTKSSEHQPRAPYQTLTPEEKKTRRDSLFDED